MRRAFAGSGTVRGMPVSRLGRRFAPSYRVAAVATIELERILP